MTSWTRHPLAMALAALVAAAMVLGGVSLGRSGSDGAGASSEHSSQRENPSSAPGARASGANPASRTNRVAARPDVVRAVELHDRAFDRLDLNVGAGAERGAVDATFPKQYSDGVELRAGAAQLRVVPRGARPAERAERDGKVVYVGAYPDIDVVQETSAGALKEGLVVHAPTTRELRFDLQGAASPFLRPDGDIGFRLEGRELALRSPAPVAMDDSGRRLGRSVARYRLEGRTMVLQVRLGRSLAYPVVVDPTFDMGQAADVALGTRNLTDPEMFMGRLPMGLNAPTGIGSDGTKLLISEHLNSRVSGFHSVPASDGANNDFTMGSFHPSDVATDGTRVAISDVSWNRVALHETVGGAISVVLGQPDTAGSRGNEGGRSLSTLYAPSDVWTDGNKIAVSDNANHRVLLWNSWPTTSGVAADVVLGQADGTTGTCNLGGVRNASTLCGPSGVHFDGTNLYVTDGSNQRMLQWSGWPTSHGEAADAVIGQPDFASGTCAAGMHQMCNPTGVGGSATHLFVTDYSNERVLVYNNHPTTTGASADVVLGTGTAGTSSSALRSPVDATGVGSGVAVVDGGNNRVLVWTSIPAVSGVPAQRVIGQTDFLNNGRVATRGDALLAPRGVSFDGSGRLHVLDEHSNTWSRFPATLSQGVVAEFQSGYAVPGQGHQIPGLALDRHPSPWLSDLTISDDGHMFMSSLNRGRVTINNTVPPAVNPPPVYDRVLGQPDLLAYNDNRGGGPSANTLASPNGVDWDGTHLAVADTANNRVLIWNGMPASHGEDADVVLGQPDFLTTNPNSDGIGAASLNGPTSVRLHEGKLFVVDQGNNRVLGWNTVPNTNREPADIVLGQSSMSVGTGSSAANRFWIPVDIAIDDHTMAVSDRTNNRIAIWNQIPTASNTPPDKAIGQAGIGGSACGVSATAICYPTYIALRDGRLAVNDRLARILVYSDVQAPIISDEAEQVAAGRATVSWNTDEDASSQVVWDTTSHPDGLNYTAQAQVSGLRQSHSVAMEGLVGGVTYYYRIRSYDPRGNFTQSAERSFTTSNVTRLAATPTFTADTTLVESTPTLNHGGSAHLSIGGAIGPGSDLRTVLRFDLGQIPAGATISQALLHMTQTNTATNGFTIQQLAEPFEEGAGDATVETVGATWTTSDGVDPWGTPGGSVTAGTFAGGASPGVANDLVAIPMTQVVDSWVNGGVPNHGTLFEAGTPGAAATYASSEHADPDKRPVLVVEWQGADATAPQIGSARIEQLSATSVRITWDTDEQASTRLEYGTTAAYGTQRSTPALVNSHSVTLTGLTPSTEYHFRTHGVDAQGNAGVSDDQVFRTSYQTVATVEDATIRSDMPTRNSGLDRSIFVGNANGSWGTARTALRFDLSSIPAGASINSARVETTLSAQGSTGTPTMSLHRINTPFVEGTGRPSVAPGAVLTSATNPDPPSPLLSGADRHVALTSAGWWQVVPRPSNWFNSVLMGWLSYDGASFGEGAALNTPYGWGGSGTSMVHDPSSSKVWIAGMQDPTSNLFVRPYDEMTGNGGTTGLVTYPAGVQYLPSMALDSTGRIWTKAEAADGRIFVARSNAARDPSAWDAPVQVAAQAIPAHAHIVHLTGDRMLLVSQDGATIRSREWDGASWGAPITAATNAAVPTNWQLETTHGVVADGAGTAWLTYVAGDGTVNVVRMNAGAWGAAAVLGAAATSAAISMNSATGAPHVYWLSANSIQHSTYSGSWSAPVSLASGLPAGAHQLSASAPNAEALAITWVESVGRTRNVKWYAHALPKVADGTTWNTRNGTNAWVFSDFELTPAATAVAPNVIGEVASWDVTAQAERWIDGTDPNHGFMLRHGTEGASINWKGFYSGENPDATLRPRLVVEYDLAAVNISTPNALTAWRPNSRNEIVWSTSGSGMTQVDIQYSTDGGATWPNVIVSGAPNTGSYFWTTPAGTGNYQVRIQAKSSGGTVLATAASPTFVLDATPPSPVTALAIPSPTAHPELSWSAPNDTGGAGMARGRYRIYRSTANGVQGVRIATVLSLTHTDMAALADATYWYTVVPVDAAGNVQPAGNVQVSVSLDQTRPNAVTALVTPAITSQPVAISWTPVTDVGSAGMGTYGIYRSTQAGLLGTLVNSVPPSSTTDTPAVDGTYYYTVAPIDAVGNTRLTGNQQNLVVYDTTAPSPNPSTGSAVANSATQMTWTITPATDALSGLHATPYGFDGAWQASNVLVEAGAANTTYTKTIRARDAAGNVTGSSSLSRATLANPPASLTATPVWTAGAGYAVAIDWAAPANGALEYKVRWGDDAYATVRQTTSGTTHSRTGLTANTSYAFQVCSVNIESVEEAVCSTVAGTTPPAPPTAPGSTNVTDEAARITWTPAAGATDQRIEVFSDASCSTTVSTATDTASPHDTSGLDPDRSYWFRISSFGTISNAWGAPTACTALSTGNGRTTIALAIDSPTVAFGWMLPGETVNRSTNLTVDTFGATGYTISMQADGLMRNASHSVPNVGPGTVGSPAGANAAPWAGYGFGFTVGSATNLEPGWTGGTEWAALPTVNTIIHETGIAFVADTANSTATRVDYSLRIPIAQQPGSYSSSITYTALPTP